MHEFTKRYRLKGWSAPELAKRWGMSIRNLGRIARRPTQRDLDAVNGLPLNNLNAIVKERKAAH